MRARVAYPDDKQSPPCQWLGFEEKAAAAPGMGVSIDISTARGTHSDPHRCKFIDQHEGRHQCTCGWEWG